MNISLMLHGPLTAEAYRLESPAAVKMRSTDSGYSDLTIFCEELSAAQCIADAINAAFPEICPARGAASDEKTEREFIRDQLAFMRAEGFSEATLAKEEQLLRHGFHQAQVISDIMTNFSWAK